VLLKNRKKNKLSKLLKKSLATPKTKLTSSESKINLTGNIKASSVEETKERTNIGKGWYW
jgi:hypothetical protein